MMMKSGLEKTFFKFLHLKAFFRLIDLFHKYRIFAENYKFSNKNDLLCAWRDFNKKILCCIYVS